MRRRALPALLGLLFPAAASAQQHWLIGRWRGESEGESGQNRRTFIVSAVDGDSVSARWGDQPVSATFFGNTLLFLTPGGKNPVVLRRAAPNRLAGTVATRGGAGPTHALWLERQ